MANASARTVENIRLLPFATHPDAVDQDGGTATGSVFLVVRSPEGSWECIGGDVGPGEMHFHAAERIFASDFRLERGDLPSCRSFSLAAMVETAISEGDVKEITYTYVTEPKRMGYPLFGEDDCSNASAVWMDGRSFTRMIRSEATKDSERLWLTEGEAHTSSVRAGCLYFNAAGDDC
jgi:hypothetical protein